MNNSDFIDDNFNEFFFKAIAFHLVVFISIYGLSKLTNLSIFDNKSLVKEIEIVQSAVRIDVVAMPKFTVQELKKIKINIEPPEEVTEEAVKETKVDETSKIEFKKVTKKIDLSKILGSLSQKKNKIAKKNKSKKINTKKFKNLILEGNKISKGSSTVGDITASSKKAFYRYIQSLPDLIRPNWKLPSYLIEEGLNCRIKVYITSTGKVIKTSIFESSGSKEFDEKAIIAIKKSSPLPKPDKEIWTKVSGGEVVLGFPL